MRRATTLGLSLGAALSMLAGAKCNPVSDLPCSMDETCLMEAEGGRCEPEGFCTFPDEACTTTGRRWHSRAPESLAGDCWMPDVAMGSTSGGGTDTDDGSTSGAMTTSSSTSSTTATGDATTDDSTSTGEDPSTTTDTGTSTTGVTMTCDEQYGTATDYMLCTEDVDTCRFNVTVNMAASCNDVCTMFGGMCIGAQSNEADLCTSTGDLTCDDMTFTDGICTCSRD